MTPKSLHDPQFGDLHWDNQASHWQSAAFFPSGPVDIVLKIADDGIIPDPIRHAIDVIANAESQMLKKVAADLLDTYNEVWNDEQALSAKAFQRQLTLETVILWPDGSAEISFDADDLFSGHPIIISMSKHGRFIHAKIGD